jgi:hypothetical protein
MQAFGYSWLYRKHISPSVAYLCLPTSLIPLDLRVFHILLWISVNVISEFPVFPFILLIILLICGLVVRVSGYRYRGPRFDSRLISVGSGTGSTQPREDNWGATWMTKSGSGLENWD